MPSLFFQRRTLWWPTLAGWTVLLVMPILPVLAWWFGGETFLACTDRRQPGILIVEGWIGYDGMSAAKAEFDAGGYRQIIVVGAFTNNRWGRQRWNYAELAQAQLLHLGVPAEKVIAAPTRETERQRTFESAWAASDALNKHGLHPSAVNVFTLGIHARRSRMVFEKVLAGRTQVGCVSWRPASYGPEPWWKSSERADEMIKETVGYLFELFLNSGRTSNRRTAENSDQGATGSHPQFRAPASLARPTAKGHTRMTLEKTMLTSLFSISRAGPNS